MSKGTILLVQADKATSELLREHFESGDYKILITDDQEEALQLSRSELPRAVILDWDTPKLDAAGLIDTVRNTPRTRHLHFTLLAQHGERTDRLDALATGADDFLTKPVDVEELGLRVRNALRRAAFDNLTNPTTGLPGPRLIEEQLRQILRRNDDDWAIIRINIRNFNPFNDLYGFLAGEEVLRYAAHTFIGAVNDIGTPKDFLGHSGADNFLLITIKDKVDGLGQEMSARFSEDITTHYSFKEREQGFITIQQPDGTEKQVPLMELKIHTVSADDGPFSDIRELTQNISAA